MVYNKPPNLRNFWCREEVKDKSIIIKSLLDRYRGLHAHENERRYISRVEDTIHIERWISCSNLNLMLCSTPHYSLCLSLHHAKTHSGPNSGVSISKTSDNQKEISKGPIHFEGLKGVWGQKHKIKSKWNFFTRKGLLHAEKVHIVHFKSKISRCCFSTKSAKQSHKRQK